jgi:hypothetical protein
MSRAARVFGFLVGLFAAIDSVGHTAVSGNFAGLVDVGTGRKMYFQCRGLGTPTVVLVGGLRASADDWSLADKSAPAVLPDRTKFSRRAPTTAPERLSTTRRAAATRCRSQPRQGRRLRTRTCLWGIPMAVL